MLQTLNNTLIAGTILMIALTLFLKVRLSGNYKKSQKTIKDAQKKADGLVSQKIREADSSLAKKEKHRLRKISNREEELRRQENAYNKRISKLDVRLESLDRKVSMRGQSRLMRLLPSRPRSCRKSQDTQKRKRWTC